MSDLDYEDEVSESDAITACVVEQTSSIKSFQDHPNNAKRFEISDDVQRNSEEGEIQSDTGEIQSDEGEILKSDHELIDLEEGEINDENTDGNNSAVCRFFLQGTCRFGKQCRFVHVGASAYKMFDSRLSSKSFHSTISHQYVYYTQSKLSSSPKYSERNGDAWEQGLEEAKKLLSIARNKKEADVEFEDKKLHLQTEKETLRKDRKDTTRKRDSNDKRKEKRSKSNSKFKQSPSEYSENEIKVKKRKSYSRSNKLSPEIWTDPWRRSRSRTRNLSRSSSSSSSLSSRNWTHKSSCSSHCSLCSSDEDEHHSDSKMRTSKPKSKLQRVFSRTFSRSRSRKRSRSRSKSRSSSLRRSLYRSYSRSRSSSSSASWCSKKSSVEKFAKSVSNKLSSNTSKVSHSPKRKLSPEASNRWMKDTVSSDWDSSSSDLTVSSITCTTVSGSHSSVDSGSVKQAKVTTGTNSKKSAHSDEIFLQDYKKNNLDRGSTYEKCQIEKRVTNTTKPNSDDKLIFDNSKETTGNKVYRNKNSPVSNIIRDKSEIPSVKKPAKTNISELELLKYLPTKNRAPAEKPKEITTKSTETIIEPKKVISISLKPKTKLVPTKSVLSSPVRKSPDKVANKPLSRREQLIRQLEAVEMAIAKKKKIS